LTQNGQQWTSGRRHALIVSGLLLASVYVAGALLADAGRLADALRQLGWAGCAAVLGLSAANYLLRFGRWQYYLAKMGRSLPAGRHLLVYLSGFAFTVSPAKAGEAVRSLYLRDQGVTYSESIAALFVERLLDLFAIVALAGIIVIDRAAYRPLLLATAALLTVVLVAVCQRFLPLWVERFAARAPRRAARPLGALANLLRSSRSLLRPRPLLFGIAIGLMAWTAEGVGFRFICQGLHIDGSVGTFIGIYALAVLAGSAAFFLPAGIGGMEIVMTTLLVEQGAALRVAIVATLLCRLATLWFAVILGVGAAARIELSDRQLRPRVAP
jgi:glycosyltransferase 2 family protein